jgi:hypothetical protein
MTKFLLFIFLCCIYSSFQITTTNGRSSLEELEVLVQKAAGLYDDKNFRSPSHDDAYHSRLNKTVLVTAANFGYLSHLLNFQCFAHRLNLRFLVISMDQHMHSHLTSLGIDSFYMHEPGGGTVKESGAVFRDEQFNMISNLKIKAVHLILKLGYDVLFSDPDIAIVKDPIPLLFSYQPYDHVFSTQSLHPCQTPKNMTVKGAEGNTGFYLMRSTNDTIDLLQTVIAAVRRYPKLDDQTIFWNIYRDELKLTQPSEYSGLCGSTSSLRSHTDSNAATSNGSDATSPVRISSCHLDLCQFSAGALQRPPKYQALLSTLDQSNMSLYTVHANMIKGDKLKENMMKANGLWLHTAKGCASFTTPIGQKDTGNPR